MKQDNKIKALFNKGYGARRIAKELNIKHHVSVTKRLRKMNLIRKRNAHLKNRGKLNITFTPIKGNLNRAAEYELIRLCCLCGFEYAIPATQSSFDLLVDFGNGLKKVQVKSSYCKSDNNTGYIFRLKKTRNNATKTVQKKYRAEEVDYFFLHNIEGNSWLIPFKLVKNQGTVAPVLRFPGYQIKEE